jgi:hypothetical protein
MNLYLRPEGDLCWIIPGCVNPYENAFQVMYPDKICYIEGILENPLKLQEVSRIYASDIVSILRMGNFFWSDVKALGINVYSENRVCLSILDYFVNSELFTMLGIANSPNGETIEALPMGQFRFDYYPSAESVSRNSYVFDKYFILTGSAGFFGVPENVVEFDSFTGISTCGEYFMGDWLLFQRVIEKLPSISVGRSGIKLVVLVDTSDIDRIDQTVVRFHSVLNELKKSYKISVSFHCEAFGVGIANLMTFKSGGVKVTISETFKYPVKKLHDYLFVNKRMKNDEPFATKTAMFGESDVSISD